MNTRTRAKLVLGLAAALAGALVAASPATAATDGWSVVTTPSTGAGNDNVNGVGAASDSDAWAVGNTFIPPDANGTTALPLTLHWNGTSWQPVTATAAPANAVLLGVSGTASDAWAVGRRSQSGYNTSFPVLLRWNGTTWSTASQPVAAGALNAVADLGPTNAWAVGRSGRFGPQLIEHWDGTTWSTVDAPPADPTYPPGGQLMAISARTATDIWALGRSSTVGAYAEHWNGTSWSLTLLAAGAGDLPTGVAAVGPNDVWATVNTQNGGAAYVQHFNGTGWTVSATRPATEYPTLAGIAARGANDIWVAGGFLGNINTPSPTREVRTLHWNGTAWTVGTAPNGGGVQVNGVTAAPGGQRVWVVGTAASSYALTRTT
jgi:hypothetical protein